MLTGCHADIVEGKVSDTRVELEQEGERLANATGGTQNSHLGQLEGKDVSIGREVTVKIPSIVSGGDDVVSARTGGGK